MTDPSEPRSITVGELRAFLAKNRGFSYKSEVWFKEGSTLYPITQTQVKDSVVFLVQVPREEASSETS